MTSRAIRNLFLLGLILSLGVLAYLKPGKPVQQSTPLTALDGSSIVNIRLRNADQLVFDKKEGRWTLTAPFSAPASQNRVEQLLEITRVASEARYPIKPDEDLTRFELKSPKATLTVGGVALDFGGTDPIRMNRYVKVGDTLHLVKDNFYHHLTAGATDYVDKQLLPGEAVVNEIVIPGLRASKSGDGVWTVTPAGVKADSGELAFQWTHSRAIDVRRLEQPAKGEPIHIGIAGSPAVDFIIVQREPSLILARPDLGLSYEVMPDVAGGLLNQPRPAPVSRTSPALNDDADPHDEHEDEPQ